MHVSEHIQQGLKKIHVQQRLSFFFFFLFRCINALSHFKPDRRGGHWAGWAGLAGPLCLTAWYIYVQFLVEFCLDRQRTNNGPLVGNALYTTKE